MKIDPQTITFFTYTNHRGETAKRSVVPLRIEYRTSQWHYEGRHSIWLLIAWDFESDKVREFELEKIKWDD